VKERSHVCIPVYIRGKYPQLRKFADVHNPYRIFGHRTLYGLEILMDKIGGRKSVGRRQGASERDGSTGQMSKMR
jgi:hypothetical protein